MADLKLFRLRNGCAQELVGAALPVERSLQAITELAASILWVLMKMVALLSLNIKDLSMKM